MRPLSDPAVPSVSGFWDFVALRQEAYWLKQEGKKSAHPLLATKHFPNVFRELDKGTLYFRGQMAPRGIRNNVFGTIVYRLSNRQEMFENLGGIPRLEDGYNFVTRLKQYYADGKPVFTSRHITPSWASYYKAVIYAIEYTDLMVNELDMCFSLKEVHRTLKQIPGCGDFLAWQMCCDLLESRGILKFKENDWCFVGPGPRGAMRLLMHQHTVNQEICLERMKWLLERQEIFLRQGSIPFKFHEDIPKFTLKNIEHSLCEYYRWVMAHWEIES